MARFIARLDDMYFEWSTIVDAPVTYGMTREEFKEYYLEEYGRSSLLEFEQRMLRVDAKGTSSHIHASAEETVYVNRAGKGETCLSLAQLKRYLSNREYERSENREVGEVVLQ